MRFGAVLKASTYGPWKDKYIDYAKLKKLLREEDVDKGKEEWTEEEEAQFVEELLNTQLEKVNAFHDAKYQELRERTTNVERRFQRTTTTDGDKLDKEQMQNVETILQALDGITKEVNELQKYSRVNFSGFLKAAKKHDRRRGAQYKVRPLLQVRLASLPFNSEDYSPLLYELSTMYSIARQFKEPQSDIARPMLESRVVGDKYTSHKFWVHPENLLEVKTYILRRLPVLVYNPKTAKVAEVGGSDPTITSLYFDNSKFSLYEAKCDKSNIASSLRLRWYGSLADTQDVFVEEKTVDALGDSDETRVTIKPKHVQSFLDGQHKMEKAVEKLRERTGPEFESGSILQRNVDEIQAFVKDNDLKPVMRANYARTAFQIPGDDRVRISIDTDVAFIREDSLDGDRSCRNPREWHRSDIDRLSLKYPFDDISQGELSKFPYALLEIKINMGAPKKTMNWVNELMSSHLVKEAPRFSKFVHGVAQLFEDHVNTFPFWLSELETDIRQDPEQAYQEELEKKAKQAADQQTVGSLLGSKHVVSFKSPLSSPAKTGSPRTIDKRKMSPQVRSLDDEDQSAENHLSRERSEEREHGFFSTGIRTLSRFSNSRYARAHRGEAVQLPPGVTRPQTWIKDMNPVRVEPKVWLANQRTFVKWQHVSVLLTTLSLGLYNAAGPSNDLARALGVVYTVIAVFAAAWGWWIYLERSRMIEARSGKDFDHVFGPIVVCIALIVALCLNFALKYRAALSTTEPSFAAVSAPSSTQSNLLPEEL